MKTIISSKVSVSFMVLMVFALVLSACGGFATPAPTQDVAQIQTQSAQTVVADMTAAAPAAPAATEAPPGPTPDPNIPVAVVPTPAAGEPSAVANFNTAIFSGPGTNYVVYGAFLGGRTAKVVGKSEDSLWWAVSVPVAPDGNGWVSAGWVTVSGADGVPVLPTPPVPPTVDMVPPGPDDPQATALVNEFVRTGPATNFPAYGVAPAGATGRVLGRSEDSQWWVVRLDPQVVGAGYGWIMTQYTSATNVDGIQVIKSPEAAVTEPPPAPPAGVPTVTAIDFVNVRSGPGTTFSVYVVAPPGTSGEAVGKSADGGWWQVRISTQYAPDGLGWVSGSWVTTQGTENVPVVESPAAPPAVQPTPPPPGGTTGCLLVAQTPADGSVYPIGTPFDATWVIQNTGTETWNTQDYDLAFVSALNNVSMHTGGDRYDLSAAVATGGTYNFTVPMLAPFGPGNFAEMWQVIRGNQTICQFYVYITVP